MPSNLLLLPRMFAFLSLIGLVFAHGHHDQEPLQEDDWAIRHMAGTLVARCWIESMLTGTLLLFRRASYWQF